MNEGYRRKKRVRINYRRAAVSLSLLILVVTVFTSVVPAALGRGEAFDRDLIRTCGDLAAEPPAIKAKSAIMYSLDLDEPVFEKKADKKLPPYSMTKLLTCYLAIENLKPDDVITVSENAAKDLPDATEMGLEPGEKLRTEDLMYATIMISANDAATALGEAVSGSEKAFAELMNETAAGWGCENTHFVNANGWDHKKHYTTARDMAVITEHCLENEKLREISLTKKYTVPATNKNESLKMGNIFLKTMKNLKVLTGGKTGSWSDTECTITLGFSDKGLNSIIVLMDDTVTGRSKDPKKLIDFAHDVTPGFKVTDSDKGVCEAWVRHGAVVKVPLDVKGLRYAYPKSKKASGVKVKTEIDSLKAPVKKGDKAGKYYIYANDEIVGSGTLYVAEDVDAGWLPSYLYISNKKAEIVLIVIILIIAAGLLLQKTSRAPRTAEEKREALRQQRNYKPKH